MSKQQMIAAIRQRNHSAREDYLTRFDEQTLHEYLRRLTSLHNRRGRGTAWVRRTTHRSIVTRAPTHA